ncbi:MAG TPA: M20/M25/M40 family metallo-hydrolase [Holophagaceae bacterium]|nr:M20/M25/M40 family metallo-hydrolase [Holophagaceae bacterium]
MPLPAGLAPALLAAALGAGGGTALAPPDAARMKADVVLLASPAFEGRLTGTPGQLKAARLVADRFREEGLKPLGSGPDPYFLPYALELRTTSEECSFLALGDRRVPLGAGAASFRLAPVEAPLVFVPEGASPAAAKGAWVARFAPSGRTDADRELAQALEAGAEGLVLLPRPGSDGLEDLRARGRRFLTRGRYGFPGDGPAPAGLPLLALDATSAGALGLDLAGLGARKAALPLGRLKLALNTSAETLHPVNVAGLLPGSDPQLKDEIVVLSAHEDHLGLQDGQLHPGADDNASGTAVLLEVARLLKDARPRRSILFLSVSGEELGLFGSRAFTAAPPVPLRSIVADLNTDMVGRNGVRTIAVTPAKIQGATGTLTRDARELAKELGLRLTDEADTYWRRSDHYTFAKAGIPSIFFFGGMEPDYHQTTDTADKIEPEKLANVARLLRELALKVADAPGRPAALPAPEWSRWKWPSR